MSYGSDMNMRICKVFRMMCADINALLASPMVDPMTRQKAGQSDNDEVIMEQVHEG